MNRSTLGTALLLVLSSCYTAEFQPDLSGAYACEVDQDCPVDQTCAAGICVSDDGPHLTISGPEPLTQIPVANTDALTGFQITLQGTGLTLSGGSTHMDGVGVLEVRIDGNIVEPRVESGNLGAGFTVGPFDMSGAEAGPHRIRISAHRLDGMPYPNPSSVADSVFFIDDGNPQVAIMSPPPGSIHSLTQPIPVTIASINYAWKTKGGDDLMGQGHTHVYSNAMYPGCLDASSTDDCNFLYLVSISGDGDPSDPRMISGEIPVEKLESLSPGPIPLQAGLQTNNHLPFPTEPDIEYDQMEIEVR